MPVIPGVPHGYPGTGAYDPPGAMPQQRYPYETFPPGAPLPPLGFGAPEELEFGSLTRGETSHWRIDFKWVFGIATALLIFLALGAAGLYRGTGAGAAHQVLTPIIENATEVRHSVKENYQRLRSSARRDPDSNIYIPDIGATVSIKGDAISSLSLDELTERVILEIERRIYARGYRQSIPMASAQGAGEERAKAACVTILSKLNKSGHSALLMPIIIIGVLALAFGILFILFCMGWGKGVGTGLVFIMGAFPGSLLLRIGHQFFWRAGGSSTFKPASHQAFRTISSLSVSCFDIALAFGALVLMIGVIGATIARKTRRRIPPFTELRTQPEIEEETV